MKEIGCGCDVDEDGRIWAFYPCCPIHGDKNNNIKKDVPCTDSKCPVHGRRGK